MKIYLAIPYSWNPDKAYEIANKVAAKLAIDGNIVFSPISHWHPICQYLPEHLRTDSNFWMDYDLPFVEWCDEVYVVRIEGQGETGDDLIEHSRGIRMEWNHAIKHRKAVTIIDHDEKQRIDHRY